MNEAEAKKKLEDAAIGIAIKHMHTREAGGAKAIVDAAVEYAQALLAAARVPVKGLTHHGPTMPHPGPSNQPLACALTADGVPIRTGMRCFDYNLNEVEIVEPYSEGAQPESSVKVRVFVGVTMRDVQGPNAHTYSGRWACLFSTREAAEAARGEHGENGLQASQRRTGVQTHRDQECSQP